MSPLRRPPKNIFFNWPQQDRVDRVARPQHEGSKRRPDGSRRGRGRTECRKEERLAQARPRFNAEVKQYIPKCSFLVLVEMQNT